jgi:hypothetical protein
MKLLAFYEGLLQGINFIFLMAGNKKSKLTVPLTPEKLYSLSIFSFERRDE